MKTGKAVAVFLFISGIISFSIIVNAHQDIPSAYVFATLHTFFTGYAARALWGWD